MADNKITITLEADGNATQVINKVVKSLGDVEKASESAGFSFTRAFESLAGFVGGQVILGAINKVSSAFISLGSDAIAGAASAEQATNALAGALARAGKLTDGAVKSFNIFAETIQATTAIEDDAVVSAGALITSLSRLSGDALQGATKAAIDLSVALGRDLDSTAKAVALAANGNVEALSKFGVKINLAKGEAVDFTQVLARLNTQFGGAAANQLNTFGGSLSQLRNNFSNLLETIGDVVVSNPAVIAVFKELSNILVGLSGGIKDNSTAFKVQFAEAINFAAKSLSIFAIATGELLRGINVSLEVLTTPITTIIDGFYALTKVLKGDFKGAIDGFKTDVEDSLNRVKAAADSNPLEGIATNLAKIQLAAEESIPKIGQELNKIPNNAAAVGVAIEDLTIKLKSLSDQGAELGQKLLGGGIEDGINQRAEALAASREQELISDQEFFDGKNQLINEQFEQEVQALRAAKDAGKLTEKQYNDAIIADVERRNLKLRQNEIARTQFEKAQTQERLSAGKSAFDALAQFQNAKTKEIAAVAKSAAIASTIISTYEGATKASSALAGIPVVGPALAVAAAAAFIAAGLARVAIISGTNLATGITEVPGGFPNDTFPANLSSGERVVSANQNEDLKRFIASNQGNAALLQTISNQLAALQNTTIVNIGNKEIVREVRDAIQDGRSLVPV